jgi:hypothetical protein
MCRKSFVDLIDFDKSEKERKALEDLRQRLRQRQAEITDALNALDEKLSS